MRNKTRVRKAVELALVYGRTDGAHHKMWVIDQMLRIMLGNKYRKCIDSYCAGEHIWDTGIAP